MNQRTIVNATVHTSCKIKTLPVPGLYWIYAHLVLTLSYNIRNLVVLQIETYEIF